MTTCLSGILLVYIKHTKLYVCVKLNCVAGLENKPFTCSHRTAISNVCMCVCVQLTSQSVLDTCFERQICMISFLSHILDSQAAGRNGYIQSLLTVAERYKTRSFGSVCLFVVTCVVAYVIVVTLAGGCG